MKVLLKLGSLSSDTQEQVPKQAIKSDEPNTALFLRKDTDTYTIIRWCCKKDTMMSKLEHIHFSTAQVIVMDPHRVKSIEG